MYHKAIEQLIYPQLQIKAKPPGSMSLAHLEILTQKRKWYQKYLGGRGGKKGGGKEGQRGRVVLREGGVEIEGEDKGGGREAGRQAERLSQLHASCSIALKSSESGEKWG